MRCLAFVLSYLSFEVVGVLVATILWLLRPFGRSENAFERWNFDLQCWWANGLTLATCKIFNLDIEILEPPDLGNPPQPPVIVFVRHSSLMDTVLTIHVIQKPSQIQLRYVLKEQLLVSPCLDIVGHRLRNWFARRGAGTSTDVEAIAALAEDLGVRQGVLIYPEGTRFTQAKRQRAIERARQRGDQVALSLALELEHTLTPRIRGPLALVQRNQEQDSPADILFLAHRGFEGSATLGQLLSGGLIGKAIELAFWRVDASDVPSCEAAFVEWLIDEWRKVDSFVAAGDPSPPTRNR